MRSRLAILALPTLALVSGCYLSHERPDRIDAAMPIDASVPRDAYHRDAYRPPDTGHDAFRAPVDVGPSSCALPGICPDVEHVIMISHRANPRTHEGCETLDIDLHGGVDATCGDPATERFAITNCLSSGFPEVSMTVIRAGATTGVASFVYAPVGCSCGLSLQRDESEVGASVAPVYESTDGEDGIVQYALAGDDVTVRVEACAY